MSCNDRNTQPSGTRGWYSYQPHTITTTTGHLQSGGREVIERIKQDDSDMASSVGFVRQETSEGPL